MDAGKMYTMHPAWQAAHELLADSEKWWRTTHEEPGMYTNAQVAGAMRRTGYADDVVVLYDGFKVTGYVLPDMWIPVNRNETLEAFPNVLAAAQMLALPTLEDALADPAAFAAGFELVDQGVHPLPPEVLTLSLSLRNKKG